MMFKVDPSQPKSSLNSHWAETSYDGQPGSWVPVIGKHWHKIHDEYMEVLEGEIEFWLEGETLVLKPGDAPLHIPRTKVHAFKFVEGVKTTFTEKTDPPGDFKESFFGTLLDTEDGTPSLFSVMRSFYDGDTFIALPGGFKAVDETVTYALSSVAKWWAPKTLKASDDDLSGKS